MDHTHRRLDPDGTPAYLEATSEQNRALYRRHGYMDMHPPVIPVSANAVLYRMWLRPGSARYPNGGGRPSVSESS
jgi:hypothetical protein